MSSDYKAVVHARDIVCQNCGTYSNLTVHHIIPKCHGGPNTPENCILLCKNCHRALHESEGYPTRTVNRRSKPKRRKGHRR